jgi:hypothetical protein
MTWSQFRKFPFLLLFLFYFHLASFSLLKLIHVLTSSEEDDGVPLSKRGKIIYDKAESTNESMPSTAESDHTATPPPRTIVAKVKASTINPSASASAPPSSSDHVSISF